MGQSRSKAVEEKNAAIKDMRTLMELMETRLKMYLADFDSKLGDAYKGRAIEVGGGRRLRLSTDVRVSTSSGMDTAIADAVKTFLDAADAAVDGKEKVAQQAAIEGVENSITVAANAIMGASQGQAVERKGFFNFFLYGAFVRIDYAMYSFNASAKKWGTQDCKAAMCYAAQMSVLDSRTISDDETTFLMSQAFQLPSIEYAKLTKCKDLIMLKRKTEDKEHAITFNDMRLMMADLDDCSRSLEAAILDALDSSTAGKH